MAIKILSVCAGGNHVTIDRDGVQEVVLAETLLDTTRQDYSDALAMTATLVAKGIKDVQSLKTEIDNGGALEAGTIEVKP